MFGSNCSINIFTDHTQFNTFHPETFNLDAYNDEQQTITPDPGSIPDGGTYTIKFGANTTTALNYGDGGATITAALEALASIGAGNIIATGDITSQILLKFIGTKSSTPEALVIVNSTNLTSGGNPLVNPPVVAETVLGHAVATHLIGNYDCEIFRRSDQAYRLSYMDATDNFIITNPTD